MLKTFIERPVLSTVISIIITILGVLGLVFCFIPKAAVQWYLFVNMIKYYIFALINKTWLSKRSMNYKNKGE